VVEDSPEILPSRFPGLLERLVHSCTDFSFYARLGGRPWISTAGYLAFLLLVGAVVFSITASISMDAFLRTRWPEITAQVPSIVIRDGKAVVSGPQPLVVEFQEQPLIIVDTSGKTTNLKNSQALLLLTASTIHLKDANGVTREMALSELTRMGPLVIDRQSLADAAAWLRRWSFFLAFPFQLIFLTGFAAFNIAVMSVVGLIAGPIRANRLAYGSLLTVAIYAYTPATLWWIMAHLLRLDIIAGQLAAIILYLIMAFYIYHGSLRLRLALRPADRERREDEPQSAPGEDPADDEDH